MKMIPTTVRMSRKQRALVEAAAENLDVSASEILRRGSVSYAARALATDGGQVEGRSDEGDDE